MQMKIIGDVDAPMDWLFPADKYKYNINGESGIRRNASKIALGNIHLMNAKVRKVLSNFDILVDACAMGEEKKAKHKQCVIH
jgi:hypothetical protein